MTAPKIASLFALGIAFAATGARMSADNAVTVVPTSSSEPQAQQQTTDSDGTPVVHKSIHKKKKTAAASATSGAGAMASTAGATAGPHAPTSSGSVSPGASSHLTGSVSVGPPPAPMTPVRPPPAISPTNISVVRSVPLMAPPATVIVGGSNPAPTFSPTVETGLPVAHYAGMGTPIRGVNTYMPPSPVVVPPPQAMAGATTHQPYYASALPGSVFSLTPIATSYSTPGATAQASRTTTYAGSDFVFTNITRKTKLIYPWKTGIITTVFWIGEGGSSISSTDNVASAWDANWRMSNRGTDTPNDRNGFAPADHAATVNPFYVALPFNDLAFPDKAREWVPRSWHRRPGDDGKPVSACKDRWVWIKNSSGRSCFAQWEDVGPLRYDHAEYVFGSERPDTYTRAGLDVSPAVAQYLGIDENKRAITAWRFVDEEDVPPGQWLKYDEQAVLFAAMHQLKNAMPPVEAPIQNASEPIQDPDSANSQKKKVGAAKG